MNNNSGVIGIVSGQTQASLQEKIEKLEETYRCSCIEFNRKYIPKEENNED